jgi:DNA (cytosine-5)-methyltransferase 1
LLDLFCGAGGAAMGYYRAGFDVVGVDINPQRNYPFEFKQADALHFAAHPDVFEFDAIHASPPCQRWSDLAKRNGNADDWPDLIGPTRDLLVDLGLPYVIENVEGAPLIDPITLCGVSFPELRVIRHRLFESNVPLVAPEHKAHPLVFTHDKRKAHYGKLDQDTAYVQVTGGGNCTVANKRDAMGVAWMTGAEANEAIPPAYTEFIGLRLLEHLNADSAA